jgi:hypothetical protein
MSILLAAVGGTHFETGGDDGESSPWPVSVGSRCSGTGGGLSTVRHHRVCAAALVAVMAARDAAEIDNLAEVDR